MRSVLYLKMLYWFIDYIMECEATFMYSGNNIETVEKTRCKLLWEMKRKRCQDRGKWERTNMNNWSKRFSNRKQQQNEKLMDFAASDTENETNRQTQRHNKSRLADGRQEKHTRNTNPIEKGKGTQLNNVPMIVWLISFD